MTDRKGVLWTRLAFGRAEDADLGVKTSARRTTQSGGQRTSESTRLWSMLDGASYPAGLWSGAQLQFTWANRRFLEMLWEAQSRFDRLGMPMRGFLSDAEMAVRFQDAAYTGEPYTDPAYPYRTPSGTETFWRLSLLPVPARLGDPFDVLITAVDVTAEHTAALQQRRRHTDLASAEGLIQRTILSTLDADEILQRALVEATEVYGADWGWIALRELDSWVFRNVHGWPVESIGRSFRDSDISLPRLAAEANGVVMAASPGLADDRESELMARHDIGAFLLVPLFAKGTVRGVMGFCWNDPEPLDENHRELGEKLSLSTTLALENARAYGHERQIARTLQSAFFAVPTCVPGVEFSHLYHSATGGASVGGDFYDVIEVAPGRVGMLIGDVAGHGVGVSALATLVRSSMHVHALQAPSPDRVLASTNDVVLRSMFGGYASAFFGLLDTTDGSLSYCSAGHPEPVLLRTDERPRLLPSRELVLGVQPEVAYSNDTASLEVGDTLLMYTDGLAEVRDPSGRQWGAERLLASVEHASELPLERIPESVFLDAFSFAEGELGDDIAMLAIRRGEPGDSSGRQERLELQRV